MTKLVKRELERDVKIWLKSREIIAVRGTRQSGKTTFLKRIKEILIEGNIKNEKIHFISFEDDFEKEKFERNPKEYIKFFISSSTDKEFFLLDEVQYIKNAGKLLKLIYDEFDNVKIFITGSSTLDLNEVSSYLVGRVLLFEMHPFSFAEFLEAKDEKLFRYYNEKRINLENLNTILSKPIFLTDLNKYLTEYITFGGYPAVVLEENYEKKKILLKNLFLTYIEKDITKIYGLKYKQRVSDLIKYLASINSSILNYNEIAKSIGFYDKEVKEVLSILEQTYIIKLVKPFYRNMTTELRKNPKVYFIDTGLRNFILGRFDFSNEDLGKLLENYILNSLGSKKVNYWRTAAKAEVDFIVDEFLPIESKLNVKITRSLRSFVETYKPKFAILANLNDIGESSIEKTKIIFVPFSLL